MLPTNILTGYNQPMPNSSTGLTGFTGSIGFTGSTGFNEFIEWIANECNGGLRHG
jgi:hypothetical protein